MRYILRNVLLQIVKVTRHVFNKCYGDRVPSLARLSATGDALTSAVSRDNHADVSLMAAAKEMVSNYRKYQLGSPAPK